LSAQNTVTGTVTDKKGTPLPGAKVEVKGGVESTLSEMDGTFKLESDKPIDKIKVYYGGMRPRVISVAPLQIKLFKENWWTRKPDKYSWMIGLQAAFPKNNASNPSFGLMVGRVKYVGWYVKGIYGRPKHREGYIDDYHDKYWTTGKAKAGFWSATAGFMVRLGCPIHLYAGAGFAERNNYWELHNGNYADFDPDYFGNLIFDAGLMVQVKKMFVNAGILPALEHGIIAGNVGVGLYF
jgi:hypothetical protein